MQDTERPIQQARALMRKGDLAGAEAMLRPLTEGDAPPAAPVLFAQVLVRQGKQEEALAAARAARQLSPKNAPARLDLAQVFSQLRRLDDAFAVLTAASIEFPDDIAVQESTVEAAFARAEFGVARAALERLQTLQPDNDSRRVLHAAILAAEGQAAEAGDRIGVDLDRNETLARSRALETELMRTKRHGEALALAEWAAGLFPEEPEPRLWQAEALLALGRPGDASTVLNSVPQAGDDALRLRRARLGGRIAQALDNPEDEIAAWKAVRASEPQDTEALMRLVFASRALGRVADGKRYAEEYDKAQAKGLPANLAAGIAALASARTPPMVMNEKIQWGWELADKSKWTFDRWWERVVWGKRANWMVMAWWRGAPERVAELEALVDGPDPAVFAGLEQTGCLFAGTHLGPTAGGVRYLDTRGHPFKTFGGGAIFARDDHILVSASPFETFRALMRELKSGTWVALGSDGRNRGRDLRMTFAGREINVPTLIPRVIRATDVPSLWWQPVWRGERIVLEAERLPDPQAGEPEEDWCRRWTTAYLAHLERLVRGAPENLMFASGIWLHAVPASAAEEAAPGQADET